MALFRLPTPHPGLLAAALVLALAAPTAAQDGTVVAWGLNNLGQTTAPAGLDDVVAVGAGRLHTVALRTDRTVVAWGSNSFGQTEVPAGLTDVVAIAVGHYHTLALKDDGTVVAWGSNTHGETTLPDGLSEVAAVDAGVWHSVALKTDGTVVAWGYNAQGQTNVPDGLSGVTAIAAGVHHNVALTADGTVVAWGSNSYGQTDVPDGLPDVVALTGGIAYTAALTADGTVVVWGSGGNGETDLPDGLSGVAALAGGYNHLVALKSDGTVVAWGLDADGQSTVPEGLSGVAAIDASAHHTVALLGPPDTPPIADAGPDPFAVVGQTVTLDGSASTGSGPLTFAWTLGGATLDGADTAMPSFCAAAPGSYSAMLTVTDGAVTSAPDEVVVTALAVADALAALQADVTGLFSDGTLSRAQARVLVRALTRARVVLVRNQTDDVLASLSLVRDEVTTLWQDQGVLTEAQATGLLARADGLSQALASPCSAAGRTTVTQSSTPSRALLRAPHPNPTHDRATVSFDLDAPGTVRLAVYDALGRQVVVLADGPTEAGTHRVTLDGAALPAGVYLVRLTTDDGQVVTQRLILTR